MGFIFCDGWSLPISESAEEMAEVKKREIEFLAKYYDPPKKREPLPKHWYKQYIAECPVCGADHSYRERVYGEKPKDPKEIYHYDVAYDWCDIDGRY